MDWESLDATERLVAEQMVLRCREVRRVMNEAPHGRGLEFTEQAVVEAGRRQATLLMEAMVGERTEGEKKGGARVAVGDGPRTETPPR